MAKEKTVVKFVRGHLCVSMTVISMRAKNVIHH